MEFVAMWDWVVAQSNCILSLPRISNDKIQGWPEIYIIFGVLTLIRYQLIKWLDYIVIIPLVDTKKFFLVDYLSFG